MNALILMEPTGLDIYIWTVVQTCWNLQRLCGFIWLFLIHFNYYCFHSLKLYKVCNIYPRSIKNLLAISINGNKFNKGFYEFHNHRFVNNYEFQSSFLDLVF